MQLSALFLFLVKILSLRVYNRLAMKKPNIKISKSGVSIIKGLTVCLLAILIMLSSNVPGLSWLATGILASFGFIGFWVLIPVFFLFGVYLMIYKKIAKKGLGFSIFGLFIIVAFLSIMATNFLLTNVNTLTTGGVTPHSAYSAYIDPETQFYLNLQTETLADGTIIKHYIEIDSSIHYFGQVSATTNPSNEYFLSNGGFTTMNSALAGGFVGFFFAGMFNTGLTPGGTTAVCIVMMIVGLLFIFNFQVRQLWRYIFKRDKSAAKDVKSKEIEDDTIEENSNNIISERQDELVDDDSPIRPLSTSEENISINSEASRREDDIENIVFNTSHPIKKASFGDDIDLNAPLDDEVDNTQAMKPAKASLGTLFGDDLFSKDSKDEEIIRPQIINPPYEEEEPSYDDTPIKNEDPIDEPMPTFLKEEENIAQEIEEVSPIIPSVEPKVNSVITPKVEPKVLPPYHLPSMDLLTLRENASDMDVNTASCDENVNKMNNILQSLHIGASVTGYTVGPSVTRYDVLMDDDKSVSSLEKFIPDFSIRLGGVSLRFEKVVIGKSTSGLEMENKVRTIVGLRECLEKLPPVSNKSRTLVCFGKNITGDLVYADLVKFPHMLVAGTTGSGKSVFIHSVILTLLMRNTPEELKLVLIDPKQVEMARYKDLPHLLCPNISEPRHALVAFQKLVEEMNSRYKLLADEGVSDIKDYNEVMMAEGKKPLPYIVIFVDEYADLSESCKEIKMPVHSIAQKARAAGIHLVIATQRPSVDVIDGVLKANIATNVALMVAKAVDSQVIIGEAGAEKLLPNGDMIIDCPLISRGLKPRVQGAFCSPAEIISVIKAIKAQRGPDYDPNFLDLEDHSQEAAAEDALGPTKVDKDMAEDKLYELVRDDIMRKEFCSISYIQRSYQVGFPKAGRLFGRLQKEGYVELSGDARGCKVIKRAYDPVDTNLGSIEQSTLVVSEDEE